MNNAANGKWGLCLLSVWPRPKKKRLDFSWGEYELWVLGGVWGKEGTTASTLRAACVGVDTNAPFTAAVQLAKDLNKQASTKYLEQPGLCLSVCFPLLFFFLFFANIFLFLFWFRFLFFFLQLLFNWTLEAELVEFESIAVVGFLGFLFSFFFLPFCSLLFQGAKMSNCPVPNMYMAHSFLWLWENTRRKTSKNETEKEREREKENETNTFL